MIKTALYDAFGCLYHPSAHTKHFLSTSSAALRSGDVTPLMGLSPKASPLLRPNMGPSAPITPLELSEEGAVTEYFALPASSTPSSPALNGVTSGSASPRYHGHHHHHRQLHTSSNLSSTYTSEDQAEEKYVHGTAGSLSQLSSVDTDMTLNPEEHPVLSSLRILSITHPHPPEHYNPHLGHGLGHDIVPIDEPISSICTSNDEKMSMELETPMLRSSQKSAGPPSSSPFPMDQGERDSISGFGQQGLV
ncbi:hypothetical protein EDD21DRAFT_385373 [Dissophora ornata]|nr:hypothetical protein EDD21DRAFT_385373 [Dissophora ornata]